MLDNAAAPIAQTPTPAAAPTPAPASVAAAPTSSLTPASYQRPADPAPQATQVISQDNSLGDAARKAKQHKACLDLAKDNPSISCN